MARENLPRPSARPGRFAHEEGRGMEGSTARVGDETPCFVTGFRGKLLSGRAGAKGAEAGVR
jgi:hypothetical protein